MAEPMFDQIELMKAVMCAGIGKQLATDKNDSIQISLWTQMLDILSPANIDKSSPGLAAATERLAAENERLKLLATTKPASLDSGFVAMHEQCVKLQEKLTAKEREVKEQQDALDTIHRAHSLTAGAETFKKVAFVVGKLKRITHEGQLARLERTQGKQTCWKRLENIKRITEEYYNGR